MMKDVRISFYRITRCGYYERGNPEPEMGRVAPLLADLHQWITTDRPTVRETQSFTPAEGSEHLPVHCYGMYRHPDTDEYLLTTWNETETGQGYFASVYADQAAGAAQVEAQEVPEGTIPGFPTYFWFIPGQNLVATIRIDNRLNGHQGMNLYLSGYLERFARWVVTQNQQPKTLSVNIAGYAATEDSEVLRLRPDFKSSPVRLQGEIDYIRVHRERIRKMIRTDEYRTGRTEPRSFLRSALRAFGLRGEPAVPNDTRYRCELTYSPDEDELNAIINHWQESHANRWDDVGFMFSGDDEVKWLSRTTARDKLSLDLDYRNEVVVREDSLMNALQGRRDELLSLVRD